MRYHFDIIDKITIADVAGRELPDDLAAIDVADTLAQRLKSEQPELAAFFILVTDEEGEEIYRVAVRPLPH